MNPLNALAQMEQIEIRLEDGGADHFATGWELVGIADQLYALDAAHGREPSGIQCMLIYEALKLAERAEKRARALGVSIAADGDPEQSPSAMIRKRLAWLYHAATRRACQQLDEADRTARTSPEPADTPKPQPRSER